MMYLITKSSQSYSGADKHLYFAIVHSHAIHRCRYLFAVAHVRFQAERISPGLFDFELGQIQLGAAPRKQAHTRPRFGETQCQPLPDPSSRSGYQHVPDPVHIAIVIPSVEYSMTCRLSLAEYGETRAAWLTRRPWQRLNHSSDSWLLASVAHIPKGY